MLDRSLVLALVGAIFLGVGFAMDAYSWRDHTGSIYVAGLTAIVAAIAIDGGLVSAKNAGPDVEWLATAGLVGTALVLMGLALRRRVFGIFGALVLAGAVGQLADEMLVETAFPFVILAVGITLVAGTFAWRKAEALLGRALVTCLPARLAQTLASLR